MSLACLLRHEADQRPYVFRGRLWWGVPSVEKPVYGDLSHAVARRQRERPFQMAIKRVHAAGANQPHEVQGPAPLFHAGTQLYQRRDPEELATLHLVRYPDNVLRHHPASAQVQVAHFTVTHLAIGKSHRAARRVEQGVGGALP